MLRYQWALNFFGLTPEDREIVIMEPFFDLSYYGGVSWETYYNWPIAYKRWYLKRLNKEIERAHKSGEQDMVSKAAHHNDPVTREMMNKRPFVPHNLKR